MALYVENIWNEVTADIPKNVTENWWSKLLTQYSDDSRVYHDINYLKDTFERFEMVKGVLENPNAVALALLFHYFEYNPQALGCSEKNVTHFNEFATDAEIPQESPLRTKVIDLLKAAITHSTEEHKTDGAYGNEDRHYFLDMDIADLGSSPEIYTEYTSKVRKEYDFLPEKVYNNLRLKVLENFLQIPNIYVTKEFREKYENQARKNIQDEVASLKAS